MNSKEDGYITLENERLRIKVACCPHAAYNSSRFDWTGFVTDILFDGKIQFAGVESENPADPMANGVGLCNEFRVPNYAAATPYGKQFLKPGIGLLDQREEAQDWKFNHRYNITPFPISVQHGKDWIQYQTEGVEWNGIHLNEYKVLRLVGNSIAETITLDNLGDQPFHCVDYNHNFLTINHEPFGPDYEIEVPCYSEDVLKESITMGNLIVKDGKYTWDGPCDPEVRTMTRIGLVSSDTYVWGMYNRNAGAGIREYVEIPHQEFCIWAAPFVCTCKVLAPIEIAPHGSMTWTRRWEFVRI